MWFFVVRSRWTSQIQDTNDISTTMLNDIKNQHKNRKVKVYETTTKTTNVSPNKGQEEQAKV